MTETVEATIADLDALLANGSHDRCSVRSVTRTLWLLRLRTSGECRRPAAAVVTVVCPEHGEEVYALCVGHLVLLRRRGWRVRCSRCDRRVAVRDLAS